MQDTTTDIIDGAAITAAAGIPIVTFAAQKGIVNETLVVATPEPAPKEVTVGINSAGSDDIVRRKSRVDKKWVEKAERVVSVPTGSPIKPPASPQKEKTASDYLKELLEVVSKSTTKSSASEVGVFPGVPPVQKELTQVEVVLSNHQLALTPVSEFGRFTPLGLAVKLDHYKKTDRPKKQADDKTVKKMEHESFVCPIDNLQRLINLTYAHNLHTFGVIVIVSDRHAVPVMFHRNKLGQRKAFIVESYGYGANTNGTNWTLQIADKIYKASDSILICSFKEGTQRDLYSCGTIALKILKQAMRMLDELDALRIIDAKVKPLAVKDDAAQDEKDKIAQTNALLEALKDKINVLWFPIQFAKYTQAGEEYAARMAQKEKIQLVDSGEVKFIHQLRPEEEIIGLREYILKVKDGKLKNAVHFDVQNKRGETEPRLYNGSIERARREQAQITFNRMTYYKQNPEALIDMVRNATGAHLFLSAQIPSYVKSHIDESLKAFIQLKRDNVQAKINDVIVYGFETNPLKFDDIQKMIDSPSTVIIEEQQGQSAHQKLAL